MFEQRLASMGGSLMRLMPFEIKVKRKNEGKQLPVVEASDSESETYRPSRSASADRNGTTAKGFQGNIADNLASIGHIMTGRSRFNMFESICLCCYTCELLRA